MAAPQRLEQSDAARLAGFMKLPRANSFGDMDLVDLVRSGFPSGTVDVVVKRIDPEGRFVKATDIVPKSTLHRRKSKAGAEPATLSKEESERVLAIAKVLLETLRIYHDDTAKAAAFLTRSHPLLDGRSPFALTIESIAGADVVQNLLMKLDAGIAA